MDLRTGAVVPGVGATASPSEPDSPSPGGSAKRPDGVGGVDGTGRSGQSGPGADVRAAPARSGRPRRALLAGIAGAVAPAGCLRSPSSGGPRYETLEIDDGPVYGPGLEDETEQRFYAALVTSEAAAAAFDLDRVPREADRAFLRETDFGTAYLGIVQVAGLNSSMELRVVDVAASRANLTLVVAIDDPTPHSDDRVITTLVVRVHRDGAPVPEAIRAELSFDGRHETVSGD